MSKVFRSAIATWLDLLYCLLALLIFIFSSKESALYGRLTLQYIPNVILNLNIKKLLTFVISQDSANCNGGEWIIRFKKVVSGRFWEDLVRGICN
ncbi:hypothetical protein NC652_040857 [Populus alba x Populus x berolinensis]|nr:hypothetical protein NC652_040857 [Populus alba x Populus x berolinensis]